MYISRLPTLLNLLFVSDVEVWEELGNLPGPGEGCSASRESCRNGEGVGVGDRLGSGVAIVARNAFHWAATFN